jgi:signal transduction histidine kinase
MLHPEDRYKLDDMLASASKGFVERETEFRIVLPDGSTRWILSRGRLMEHHYPHPTVVGIAVDITERRQAEETRRRTEQLATLGRLAATVAHEINNPLEAVNNVLHLLKGKIADEPSQELLEIGQTEVRRIADIASATLRFAREAPHAVELALRDIVENVLAIFAGRLRSRGIAISTRFTTSGEMNAVPGEIRQVVANLIGNAIEAMDRGGKLCLHLHDSFLKSGPAYRLSISDTGPGIPPAVRTRMFEPFFTTKAETGTGLGLYVVNEIIAGYGGILQLRTATGEPHGTTFSVVLPKTLSSM